MQMTPLRPYPRSVCVTLVRQQRGLWRQGGAVVEPGKSPQRPAHSDLADV